LRHAVHYDIYEGKSGWDPERYINIWVANLDGILGSASFPGMAPFPEEDGIVIDPQFVGAIGVATKPFDMGHTLTHEMGHYFGLYHIWGLGNGGCSTDDFIEDTPEQETAYVGCPEYPQHSCGTSNMFMNFMDFTDDRCLALFTRGQVERMQSALMGLRSSLLDNTNACAPPDTVKIPVEAALIFYAPGSRQVIISLESDGLFERKVRLYSSDGRLMADERWNSGSIFWMDAEKFSAGFYVVELEENGKKVFKKIVKS
jgi:hypothetical protein